MNTYTCLCNMQNVLHVKKEKNHFTIYELNKMYAFIYLKSAPNLDFYDL